MMEVIHTHPEPEKVRGWLLTTSHAHKLYKRFNRHVHQFPEKVMRHSHSTRYPESR